MINFKVRAKNKLFWVEFIPALLMLVQTVASLFGWHIDFSKVENQLLAIVNAVFMVLALLGIVTDPTTKGLSDSQQAMTYEEPKDDYKC